MSRPRRFELMLVPFLLSVLVSVSASAQQIASARFGSHQSAPTVMQRTISIALDRVPLSKAIPIVAERANVKIYYDTDALGAVTEPVTVRATNVTLEALFVQLFAGTHLRAVVIGGDVVGIQPTRDIQSAAEGVLVGHIVNAATKQAISGATITVTGHNASVKSDEDGRFRLPVGAGKQTVLVRAVGFSQYETSVTVDNGQTVELEIVLEASANVLNEIVVTGTVVATERKAIPTPITVIRAEEIERRGITRVDELLRGEVPGLVVMELGSSVYGTGTMGGLQTSEMYSRGSSTLDGSANPIKTYIDGVELLDPSYLGTIDPQSIDRIEIITGPQAATIYGSGAMGGVMQIFTKRGAGGSQFDATLSLKYGMLQNNFSPGLTPTHTDALNITGGTGPSLTYAGSLSYLYTGQWQPKLFNQRFGGSLGATHATGPLTVSGSVSLTRGRNGTWNNNQGCGKDLKFVTNVLDGTFRVGTCNRPATFTSQQISDNGSQTFSMSADYRATETWQHHLTIGRNQNSFVLRPNAPNYNGYNGGVGGDSLFRTATAAGHRVTTSYNSTLRIAGASPISATVTAGITAATGERTNTSGCLANKSATSMVGCTATEIPSVSASVQDKSTGIFGSWQTNFFQRVFLTLGIRGERNPNYGRDHRMDWTPTNGLTYAVDLGDLTIKFLGSYGSATRPPEPGQRLEQIRNEAPGFNISRYISYFEAPELRPEYSHGPQGGIEIYYGSRASLTVNHYKQTVSDLIQAVVVDSITRTYLANGFTTQVLQYQYQNVAKIRQIGWEGTASLTAGPLTAKGTYSWNDSRVLESYSYASGLTKGDVFQGIPTHTGNITLSFSQRNITITLVNNYFGSMVNNRGSNDMSYERTFARITEYTDYAKNSSHFIRYRKGYVKSDLAMSHRINRTAAMTLNMVNVGNSFASEESRLNPSLGRQTSIGITLRR